MKNKRVLVTVGSGNIGFYTAVELIGEGFNIIIVDNLCNSENFILERLKKLRAWLSLTSQSASKRFKLAW
jgi:UDP-glucose 4-epimerase